jgi:hypothetical protein
MTLCPHNIGAPDWEEGGNVCVNRRIVDPRVVDKLATDIPRYLC